MKKSFFRLFTFSTLLFVLLSAQKPSSEKSPAPPSTPSANAAPITSVNLKTQMPAPLQKKAGLNKLTKAQIKILNQWMTQYLQNQNNPQDSIQAHAVSVILSEGQYVKLGDGEVWTVSPNDWIYTYYWQAGDPIEVGQSGDVLFPILLTNGTSGQTVNAKKSSTDAKQAFSQSFQITQILEDGQFIELSDGSSWQVEPSARYMVQGWSLQTPIFVVKRQQNTTGAPYELYNGMTSRSVLATQIKAPTKKNSKTFSKQKSLNPQAFQETSNSFPSQDHAS